MTAELDDITSDFLVEAHDSLNRVDQDLLNVEKDPTNKSYWDSIFRTVHTLKGTSGFLSFKNLESTTHIGEELLSKLRAGTLSLSEEITSALLSLVDAIREMLAEVERTGKDGTNDYAKLKSLMIKLRDGGAAEELATADSKQSPAKTSSDKPATSIDSSSSEKATFQIDPSLINHELLAQLMASDDLPENKAKAAIEAKPTIEAAKEEAPAETKEPTVSAPSTEEGKQRSVAESTMRVDVHLLDKLMSLIGELVLTRNQLLRLAEAEQNSDFNAMCTRLSSVTTDLQERIVRTRMQPVGSIWKKFPKVVRDLSITCGKKVRLEMEGAETELDKTLLEAIKDPLTHIVRNAVDHGIEKPQVRLENGKLEEGTLVLRATHESGYVTIEIIDDGGGINPDKIKAKAIEKGLITKNDANNLDKRGVLGLLFLPGFSTAEQVTNISGRGVGMDVVRSNITAIGGTVELDSVLGKGTIQRLRIPLTLAIVPALIIRCAGEIFAVAQAKIAELVRLDDQLRVEHVHGAPVIRLRDQLLPLIDLREQLDLPHRGPQNDTYETRQIMVIRSDNINFGLIVDRVIDTQEIVVKPLAAQIKHFAAYAGTTIMGDGSIALILDPEGIAKQSKLFLEHEHSRENSRDTRQPSVSLNIDNSKAYLVTETLAGQRQAIAMSQITRLEDIEVKRIEKIGSQYAIQYRGDILPLIVPEGLPSAANSELSTVIIFTTPSKRDVGLIVNKIIDLTNSDSTANETQLGDNNQSIVISGRITNRLDLEEVVRNYQPRFFEDQRLL